jgi:hypothetical protein
MNVDTQVMKRDELLRYLRFLADRLEQSAPVGTDTYECALYIRSMDVGNTREFTAPDQAP